MEDNQTSRQREESYIISESQEISVGESPLLSKFFSTFPAFAHRNYQLYFFGQLISMAGMWMQKVAQGWLVFQLTHSAFWVGVVSALGLFPLLFFTLPSGVIVDRVGKKQLLYFTNIIAMVLAFALGFITVTNNANVLNISVLAFLLGLTDALDKPARQAFVIEMVGKKDLQSAIALNAGIFNGARVIGPAITGVIIGWFGVGTAFMVNAVSYLTILAALYYIKVKEIIPSVHPNPLTSLSEGISYAYSHIAIRSLLLFAGCVSIFGWSFTTILPVVAEVTFNLKADGLGYLYAASGAGAVVSTVLLSAFPIRKNPVLVIILGNLAFSVPMLLFSLTTNVSLAFILLFLSGAGLVTQFAVINNTIQHIVPDGLRGRVMSMFVLMAIGTSPIGSFQIGVLSEYFGTPVALATNALLFMFCAGILFLNSSKIKKAYYS